MNTSTRRFRYTILVFMTMFVLSVQLHAQRVEVVHPGLYGLIDPASICMVDDVTYALYATGQIARANVNSRTLESVTVPENTYAKQIFPFDGKLWLQSTANELWYRSGDGGWNQVNGVAELISVNRRGELYVSDGLDIDRIEQRGTSYERRHLLTLQDFAYCMSFYATGDTVIFFGQVAADSRYAYAVATETGTQRINQEDRSPMHPRSILEGDKSKILITTCCDVYTVEKLASQQYAFHPWRFEGLQRIVSINPAYVGGRLEFGIVGRNSLENVVIATIHEDSTIRITPVTNDEQETIRRVVPTTRGLTVVRKESLVLQMSATDETTIRSPYPQLTNLSYGLWSLTGVINGVDRPIFAGADTIYSVDHNELRPLAPIPDTLRSLLMPSSATPFAFLRGDRLVLMSRVATVSYDVNTNTHTIEHVSNNGIGLAPLLYDSSFIRLGGQHIIRSTPFGSQWTTYPSKSLPLASSVLYSNERVILLRNGNRVWLIHNTWFNSTDTISAKPSSFVDPEMIVAGLVDSVGVLITRRMPRTESNYADTISIFRVSTSIPPFGKHMKVPDPPLHTEGQEIAGMIGDTIVYMQLSSGRVLLITKDTIIKSYTVPVGHLGPFSTWNVSQDEAKILSTKQILLRSPTTGLELKVHLGDTISSTVNLIDHNTNVLSVSPTPAQERITIQLSKLAAAQTSTATLHLVDVNGNLVADFSSELPRWTSGTFYGTELQLDVQNVPNGVYFIVLTDNQSKHSAKVVVQR